MPVAMFVSTFFFSSALGDASILMMVNTDDAEIWKYTSSTV